MILHSLKFIKGMLTHTKNSTLKLAKEILLQVPLHITYPKMTLF